VPYQIVVQERKEEQGQSVRSQPGRRCDLRRLAATALTIPYMNPSVKVEAKTAEPIRVLDDLNLSMKGSLGGVSLRLLWSIMLLPASLKAINPPREFSSDNAQVEEQAEVSDYI